MVNYLVALVDDSGGGKSDAESIGSGLITAPPWLIGDAFRELPPGSGEGLADLFMGMADEPNPDKPEKPKKIRRQVRHNAYLYLDEGQAFIRTSERAGSTIAPALRTAWKGAILGQQNATEERSRVIARHNYSLGVVMAFQPSTIEPLLSPVEQNAGTPQRFSYVWGNDPDRPRQGHRPAWPGPLGWQPPQAVPPGGYQVDPVVLEQIQADDDSRGRAGSQVVHLLDVHRPLMMVKFALLLMLLDQRTTVSVGDWHLAGMMWDTSCRVRSHLLARAEAEAGRREQGVNDRFVRRQRTLDADVDERAMAAAIRQAVNKVKMHHDTHPEPGCTRRCVTLAIAHKYSQLVSVDDVILRAIGADLLTAAGSGHYVPGKRAE